jgi:ABC-type polysaccharide/polyol phosphate export permease
MTTGTLSFLTRAPFDERTLSRLAQLIRISALRSLKVRYRGSALGVVWSLANPVLLTAVYTAIFGTAFKQYYGGSVTRYVVSAFVGLAVATFFLNATSEALTSVVMNGPLLNKIPIKPVVFPLSAVAANFFQQLITTFPIVLILSLVLTHDVLRALLVPVVLCSILLLSTGFGLALGALYVFYRDLPYLWQIVGFMLWMTSPLFYPIEVAAPAIRRWFEFNPVAQDMSALREVVFGQGPIHFHYIWVGFIVGLIALVLGAVFFRATEREFMDLL